MNDPRVCPLCLFLLDGTMHHLGCADRVLEDWSRPQMDAVPPQWVPTVWEYGRRHKLTGFVEFTWVRRPFVIWDSNYELVRRRYLPESLETCPAVAITVPGGPPVQLEKGGRLVRD